MSDPNPDPSVLDEVTSGPFTVQLVAGVGFHGDGAPHIEGDIYVVVNGARVVVVSQLGEAVAILNSEGQHVYAAHLSDL